MGFIENVKERLHPTAVHEALKHDITKKMFKAFGFIAFCFWVRYEFKQNIRRQNIENGRFLAELENNTMSKQAIKQIKKILREKNPIVLSKREIVLVGFLSIVSLLVTCSQEPLFKPEATTSNAGQEP